MKKVLCFFLTVIVVAVLIPVSASAEQVYGCASNDDMKIALTFDDGPHPRVTNKILDVLSKYGVKATFFMVGENVKNYPDTARRVAREGHEIGNHTYTHPHIKNMSADELMSEMVKCDKIIKENTGVSSVKLFRPPEGVIDSAVKAISSEKGYSIILWRVDTRDWAGTSVNEIKSNIDKNVVAGDIILMHDYISKKCHTVEVLDEIIPMLIGKGYEFVTVSELIGQK